MTVMGVVQCTSRFWRDVGSRFELPLRRKALNLAFMAAFSSAVAVGEAINHFKDFGITTFAQVALLQEEGLTRRLGPLGSWIYRLASGDDNSMVVPDAPPLSQNASATRLTCKPD